MNFKKSVLIISLLLILSVSIGMVSNSSDIVVSDIDSEDVSAVAVDQVDDSDGDISVLENGEEQTFSDIQDMIDKAKENDTIVLNENGMYLGNGNAIIVDKSITIDGNDSVFDARNLSQILIVYAQNVKIMNLNLINGYYAYDEECDGHGGSLCWYGADGCLINCSFVDNYAGYKGGAIYLDAPNFSIDKCIFKNNYAIEMGGGAIAFSTYNDHNCTNCSIVNSNFVSNHDDYGWGGAISWDGDYGSIVNSTFVNNYNLNTEGGAIDWIGDYGSIVNCTFINNRVNDGYSGAVDWDDDYGSIVNCTFINNTAKGSCESVGGAIFLWYCEECSIIDCLFENNYAQEGSAIYMFKKVNIINNTFNNNPYYETVSSLVNIIPEKTLLANGNKFNFIKVDAVIDSVKLSTTYNSGKTFNIKVSDENGKVLSKVKLALKVYTGKAYKTYYVTTNSKGIASFKASTLAIGTHKVVVSSANKYVTVKAKTSYIVVKKAPTVVTAKKVTYKKGAKKILYCNY